MGRASRWVVGGIVGGGASLVGDHLHVTEGVLYYPHPVFWGQAWWVFPLFFGATISIFAGVNLVHPSPPVGPDAPRRAAAGDFIAFLTAYAFTAFASVLPNVVVLVLLGTWLARVARGMPLRHVLFCGIAALLGTAFEATWSGLGMFTYRHPDFLGVPRWLPFLYLHAALAGDSARLVVDPRR